MNQAYTHDMSNLSKIKEETYFSQFSYENFILLMVSEFGMHKFRIKKKKKKVKRETRIRCHSGTLLLTIFFYLVFF